MKVKERQVQTALGLNRTWDVYVKFPKEDFYTIYIIKAVTNKDAKVQVRQRLQSDIKLTNGCVKFAIGPDPVERMTEAKYKKFDPV